MYSSEILHTEKVHPPSSHPSFIVLSAIILCSQYPWTSKLSGKTSLKLQTLTQHWTVKVNMFFFFLTFRTPPSAPLPPLFFSLVIEKLAVFYCAASPFSHKCGYAHSHHRCLLKRRAVAKERCRGRKRERKGERERETKQRSGKEAVREEEQIQGGKWRKTIRREYK